MLVSSFIAFLSVILVLYFWETLRKKLLPKSYYCWEENLRSSLEKKVKENIFFVFFLTLLFSFLFVFFLYIGIRPWYSIWVFVFGFLVIVIRKINLVQTIYITVLASSILPTLILFRLILIEAMVYFFEVLANISPLQQKMLLGVVLGGAVPEALIRKIMETIKQGCSQEEARLLSPVQNNTDAFIKDSRNKSLSKLKAILESEERRKNSEGIIKSFYKNREALKKLPVSFNRFSLMERVWHIGKASNLNNVGYISYTYEKLLTPFLETKQRVTFNSQAVINVITLLNSPEVIAYCDYLKNQGKIMGANTFSKFLGNLIEQGKIDDLSREEVNLFYNMLLVKLSTDALPQHIIEKGDLAILFDKSSAQETLDDKVKKEVLHDAALPSSRWSYNLRGIRPTEILNAEAFMKLIKEQHGLALKEKELAQRGLTILAAERSHFLDYWVKISSGEQINLECKSIKEDSLLSEIKSVQDKLREGEEVNLYWENTETWEKTLFKVTKAGYEEIYKEAPERK